MSAFYKKTFVLLIISSIINAFFFSEVAYAKKVRQAFERSLIVLAPSSMTSALQEVLSKFGRRENISVSASFGSTYELADQIEQGEPANIYISESPEKIKDLQQKGLLNVFSITNLASDRLVLIVPKKSFLIKKLGKFEKMEEKLAYLAKNSLIALPDPDLDNCGKLAKSVFEKLELWEKVQKRMVKSGSTRAALYLTTNGNTPAIVYASDANNNDEVEIIGEIPEYLHDKIILKIAAVAEIGSNASLDDANKFINFIKSDYSKEILQNSGYKDIE